MASSKYLSFSSSLLPSPLSQSPNNNKKKNQNKVKPTTVCLVRCAFAAPGTANSSSSSPSDKMKKRHWKQGEYPGVSETYIPPILKKNPIKNVKKKLDRKSKAKAWVNTITETLSERIQNKQWLQALEIQVERCGIRMVNLQDAVDFAHGASNAGQQYRSKILDEDMVKPHAKRAKFLDSLLPA